MANLLAKTRKITSILQRSVDSLEGDLPYNNICLLYTSTVAGVTLLSFLTGILVLPKLATGPAHTTNHYMQIAILNDVVDELSLIHI